MNILKKLLAFLVLVALTTNAQEIIHLYSGPVPNSRSTDIKEAQSERPGGMFFNVIDPTLEIYLPEKGRATGSAVIICPGGAYGVVVYQGEGIRTAREFAKNGIIAFVLKYRLPNDATMVDKKIGPLQDAQQAIKTVRENASRWEIDPHRVGIMGFSAGGHLASTAATHFQKALIENRNQTNLRPDFQILVYPVISMQENLTHADSRRNLLGANPLPEIINLYSNELQVDEDTPPAYITHAGDDSVVDVDNSILYYEALRHHHVPVEMHLYPKGSHGFVLFQEADDWMTPLFKWMKNSGWIDSEPLNQRK